MLAPTITGLLSISLIKIYKRTGGNRLKLIISLIPILIFLAIRYNYGNDYPGYHDIFNESINFNIETYEKKDWHTEVGWLILNKIFNPLGFYIFVAILAIFNIYSLSKFIHNYTPSQYYWLAIFLYVFNSGHMLIQLSSIRQTLAINIFLLSINYIIKRKALIYICLILLASTFHTSAYILLPLYFLNFKREYSYRIITATSLLLYFSLTILSPTIKLLAIDFITSSELSEINRYSYYEESGSIGSGIGFLFITANFLILLHYQKYVHSRYKIIFNISILYYLAIPLTFAIIMVGRIGMYFSIASIAVIPIIASKISNKYIRHIYIAINAFYYLHGYVNFFTDPIWTKAYSNYLTIFE